MPLTELFTVWDHFPIHHFRRNNKPIIAIGHKKKKQLLIQKLHHPNYLKRATYYHELLEKGHVQSQTALAKQVGISRTKTRLILQLLELDEEIKDSILKIDDSDPGLNFLSVYRLQPLLQLRSKERQRRKFWQMIEEQYPGQNACYMIWKKTNSYIVSHTCKRKMIMKNVLWSRDHGDHSTSFKTI